MEKSQNSGRDIIPIRIGIDVGSTTVKIAVLDDDDNIIYSDYRRHRADIRSTIIDVVNKAFDEIEPKFPAGEEQTISVKVTGSGGLSVSQWLNIPFIQEYRLDWKSPSQVEIVVYEKSILAAVNYMNLYMYFDKDGMVLESSAEKIDKIPIVEGLELSSIVLYNKLPVKDEYVFSRLVSLAQSLSNYNIFAERILLYSQNQVNLYIGDIEVHFGVLNDIEEKTADLNNIFPEISGQKGILYMDNYGENKSYTFEQTK